jgi:hypothetical protein
MILNINEENTQHLHLATRTDAFGGKYAELAWLADGSKRRLSTGSDWKEENASLRALDRATATVSAWTPSYPFRNEILAAIDRMRAEITG